MHWLYVGFFQQLFVLAVIAVASLMTPAPAMEVAEPFFWRPALLTEHRLRAPGRYARALLWYALSPRFGSTVLEILVNPARVHPHVP